MITIKRNRLLWSDLQAGQEHCLELPGQQLKLVQRKNWRHPVTGEVEVRNVFYKFPLMHDGAYSGFEAFNEYFVSQLLLALGIPHVEYTLNFVDMPIDDNMERVSCCVSYDYKGKGQTAMPLDLYCKLVGESDYEKALDAMGLRGNLNQLYLVDFLIRNVRRSLSDVELYNTASGSLVMSPLFDNGSSLILDTEMLEHVRRGELNLADDVEVEGLAGTVMLSNNLGRITQPVPVQPLTQGVIKQALYGFNSVLGRVHIEAIANMLEERYEYAKRAKVLVER